jgi:hypothetical protein
MYDALYGDVRHAHDGCDEKHDVLCDDGNHAHDGDVIHYTRDVLCDGEKHHLQL